MYMLLSSSCQVTGTTPSPTETTTESQFLTTDDLDTPTTASPGPEDAVLSLTLDLPDRGVDADENHAVYSRSQFNWSEIVTTEGEYT